MLENNDYKIPLIESYPCDNKDELLEREKQFIRRIDCVNKVLPKRTRKEYNMDNKDKNQSMH